MALSEIIEGKLEAFALEYIEHYMERDDLHVSVEFDSHRDSDTVMVHVYDEDGNPLEVDDGNFDIDISSFLEKLGIVVGRLNDMTIEDDE